MNSKSYQIGVAMAMEKTALLPALAPVASAVGGGLLRTALGRMGGYFLSRKVLGDAATGAVMTGGFNALTAKPGERWDAFKRGLLPGAFGGVAMRGISSGMTMLRGVKDPASKLLQDGPWSNHLNNHFWQRQLTRPGLVAAGASFALPTGAKPDPMPMTNIPPGVG